MEVLITVEEVEALGWEKNPKPLKLRGGVYRIVDRETGNLLYVGSSGRLSERLAPSVHPVYDRQRHDVYIHFEADKAERHYLEARCIAILKPLHNQRRGPMPYQDEKLMRAYYDRAFAGRG